VLLLVDGSLPPQQVRLSCAINWMGLQKIPLVLDRPDDDPRFS